MEHHIQYPNGGPMGRKGLADECFKMILDQAETAATQAITDYAAGRSLRDIDTGACGFGWVDFNPATHPFIRWCKKQIASHGLKYDRSGNIRTLDGRMAHGEEHAEARRAIHRYGRAHWKRGWQWWNPGEFPGQAVYVKELAANAFAAKMVEGFFGANDAPYISAGSRLD